MALYTGPDWAFKSQAAGDRDALPPGGVGLPKALTPPPSTLCEWGPGHKASARLLGHPSHLGNTAPVEAVLLPEVGLP